MEKKNKNMDDDIFVFTEDDLDLSDDEKTLSEELESQSINSETKDTDTELDFDDFDDFSAFNNFQVPMLETENTDNTFEVNTDNHDNTKINNVIKEGLQLDNKNLETKKIQTKKDISDMDFDTLDEYLDLSNDKSMIKDTIIKSSDLNEEESEYLDQSLEEKLEENQNEKEQLNTMDYKELNQSLDLQEINHEKSFDKNNDKKEKESIKNHFLHKLSEKLQKNTSNIIDDVDLNKMKEQEQKEKEEAEASDEILNSEFNFNGFENTFDDLTDKEIDDFDSSKNDFETNLEINQQQENQETLNTNKVETNKPKLENYDFDELIETPTVPIDYDDDEDDEDDDEILNENELDFDEVPLPDEMDETLYDEIKIDEPFNTTDEKIDIDDDFNKNSTIKSEKDKHNHEKRKYKKRNEEHGLNLILTICGVLISICAFVLAVYSMVLSMNLIDVNNNFTTSLNSSKSKIESTNKELNSLKQTITELQESKNTNETLTANNWTEIIKEKLPMTVSIVNQVKKQDGDKETIVTNSGSGIIIDKTDSELIILTNQHVIADASDIGVTFSNGSSSVGKVKNSNVDYDLATVTIPITSLNSEILDNISVAELKNETTTEIGDEVISIGNALGQGLTVTNGIISGKDKAIQTDTHKSLTKLLQTDTAINPGNSGGPLLNKNGDVIGICVAKSDDKNVEGVGFAIPITNHMDIINSLK